MSFEVQVRSATRALLPTVDIQTVNERQIREMVAAKLGGADVSSAKHVIKEEIQMFLAAFHTQDATPASQQPLAKVQQQARAAVNPGAAWAPQAGGKRVKEEEGEEEEAKPPAAKLPRTEGGAGAGPVPAAAGSDLACKMEGGEVTAVYLDLPGPKRISVDRYGNKPRIDFRKYYEDKATGELKPGKEGVSIPLEAWDQLGANLAGLTTALQAHDLAFRVQLTPKVRAAASNYKASWYIDIRETFTTKEGVEGFSTRGLTLAMDSWNKFTSNFAALTRAVEALREGEPLPQIAPAKAPAAPRPKAEEGAPQAGLIGETQSGDWYLTISAPGSRQPRRVTVGKFKGNLSIGVREYYEKDGQFLPSMTGLNLGAEGWHLLYDRRDLIQAAVEQGKEMQESCGGLNKMSVQIYKGKTMVAFREYYQDKATGEDRPGKKGINLTADQWSTFYSNMEAVREAVQKHQ